MKGFLRFAGVIEFLLYIAGVIIYAFNVPLVGVNIFYFILFIVLGPTIAVLLFAVAQILENTEVNDSKLDKLNKKVDLLVDKLVDDPSFEQNNEEGNSNIKKDLYCPDCESYFGDIQCDPNYSYRYCDSDIVVPHQDVLRNAINTYAKNIIKETQDAGEELDQISEIVTIRFLVKKKKINEKK